VIATRSTPPSQTGGFDIAGVDVPGAVDVIEPVIVAALVNGNDAVAVADTVNDRPGYSFGLLW
jgi:hypothetical protein